MTMPRDLDVSSLYRGAINLWVEDPLAADYLATVWGSPPEVVLLIGGGNLGVRAILDDAEKSGFSNVFGLIDGDFRPSNRADWMNPAKTFRTFALSAHEVENHLLDPAALAGCVFNNVNSGVGRTAVEIEAEMTRKAGELGWWMSCRDVLSQLSHLFRDDFPGHPKCPHITDQAQAESFILVSPWFATLSAKMAQATDAVVRRLLAEAKTRADSQILSGEWRLRFSGKEIFHHVRSWIYDSSGRRATPTDLDADVAKAVARWQFEHDAFPAEIHELLMALRSRVGIP